MDIRAVYFDFGFVIGYPTPGIERRFFYLDWNGIATLYHDSAIAPFFRADIKQHDIEAFFIREVYDKFVLHEQTDLIDPQSEQCLYATLHQLFTCPITASFMDRILTHLDTMKFIQLDATAIEVIRQLQQCYTLSLISNMMLPGKLLIAKLRSAKLASAFQTLAISSDVGFIKPHPEIFLQTLRRDRLRPEQVVFVGDTYAQDIRGAQQVGMHTIWLNNRHEEHGSKHPHPPDAEISSIEELLSHPVLKAT